MEKNKQKDDSMKIKAFDVDRMINEGLAGGWEGEHDHNGRISYYELNDVEAPPTLNGRPTR